MHELPVTESVLEIALRHAKAAEADRVTDVYLVLGQLATIVDDSVAFYWDIINRGTPAEGARLHFRRLPAELYCLACNVRYQLEGEELACPVCKGDQVKVVAGDEFYMEAIEVEGDNLERKT